MRRWVAETMTRMNAIDRDEQEHQGPRFIETRQRQRLVAGHMMMLTLTDRPECPDHF